MPRPSRRRPCVIEQVGKSRNGAPRWWCRAHGASATARYGARLNECEAAYLTEPAVDCFELTEEDFPGGVGIWGAVEPIYNTSSRQDKPGVHVHARMSSGDEKEIDKTFDAVSLRVKSTLFETQELQITQKTAVAFYVSRFLGRSIKYLFCVHCGEIHLDADYFAVKPHKKHLCHACGRNFQDSERGISNPIVYFRKMRADLNRSREIIRPSRSLDIQQSDYPGGIQIWASNPALLWTSDRPEEEGIHVHLYEDATGLPVVDETFSDVSIDGIKLDVSHVQHLMAQHALSYLKNKVVALRCPACAELHFDRGDYGFNPHKDHVCEHCGTGFETPGRRRLVVSNPLVSDIDSLFSLWSRRREGLL